MQTLNSDYTIGILGCSGFIGSGLMSTAHRLNIKTKGLSRRSPTSHTKSEANDQLIIGDANDHKLLTKFFISVDIVIDCASSLKPSASKDSSDLMEAMLLDRRIQLAAREGINKYIYISSGGALYPGSTEKTREDAPMKPSSTYGLTKHLCENIIAFHSRSSDMSILSARMSNPYGYYHKSRSHGFVNVLVRNAINGVKTMIYGDPIMIQKDYIYIDDATQALLALSIQDTVGHAAVNVGFGSASSLSEIISLVGQELGIKPYIEQLHARNHDKQQFCLDTTLLRNLTDFEPQYSLREGVRQTIKWETLSKSGLCVEL